MTTRRHREKRENTMI